MKRLSKIPAILFAGGKSSRMGEDKALLPFGGYGSLAEFGYRKLEKIFENVYMSSKSNKFDFNPHVILDKYEQSSPLVGIISVFDEIKSDAFFVLSVDMPLVEEKDIIQLLDFLDQNMDCDALIAQSPSGIEPLFGIYKRGIYGNAIKFLNDDNHKLNALIKQSRSNFLKFYNEDIFININYRSDYENALKLI